MSETKKILVVGRANLGILDNLAEEIAGEGVATSVAETAVKALSAIKKDISHVLITATVAPGAEDEVTASGDTTLQQLHTELMRAVEASQDKQSIGARIAWHIVAVVLGKTLAQVIFVNDDRSVGTSWWDLIAKEQSEQLTDLQGRIQVWGPNRETGKNAISTYTTFT
jgi:hypothetical protein